MRLTLNFMRASLVLLSTSLFLWNPTAAQELEVPSRPNFKNNMLSKFDSLRFSLRNRISKRPADATGYSEMTSPDTAEVIRGHERTQYTGPNPEITPFSNTQNIPIANHEPASYLYANQGFSNSDSRNLDMQNAHQHSTFAQNIPASKRVFELQDQLAHMKQENESLKRSNQFLNKELAQHKALVSQAQKAIDSVTIQVDQAREKNETLQNKISKLEMQLSNQSKEAARMLGDVTNQLNSLLAEEISNKR